MSCSVWLMQRFHRADDERQGENEEDMVPVARRRGGRSYRGGKKVTSTSPWMIGVVALLGISVFLLLLLALGVVSLPIGSDAPKIQTVDHHFVDEHEKSSDEKYVLTARSCFFCAILAGSDVFLSVCVCLMVVCSGGMEKRENQWTEVLSWEPRAYIYHNFLVSLVEFNCRAFFPDPSRNELWIDIR